MNLKPLYEKIVVKMESKQQVASETGLTYIKDLSLSKNTTITGKVVAVGQGRLLVDGSLRPLLVNVGDKVLYSKMQGESYNDGKDDYTILSESNILAVLDESEEE